MLYRYSEVFRTLLAITDLDPKAAAKIKFKRGDGEKRPPFFADYVDSRYQGTIESAGQRRAAMDDADKADLTPVSSINDRIRKRLHPEAG